MQNEELISTLSTNESQNEGFVPRAFAAHFLQAELQNQVGEVYFLLLCVSLSGCEASVYPVSPWLTAASRDALAHCSGTHFTSLSKRRREETNSRLQQA